MCSKRARASFPVLCLTRSTITPILHVRCMYECRKKTSRERNWVSNVYNEECCALHRFLVIGYAKKKRRRRKKKRRCKKDSSSFRITFSFAYLYVLTFSRNSPKVFFFDSCFPYRLIWIFR